MQSRYYYYHYECAEGFSHASQPSSIDLNAVRLCFQVFLKDPDGHNFNIPLEPVVSEPIYDKKAMSDLVICKLSKPSCNVAGGEEIILLCEKVNKRSHIIPCNNFDIKSMTFKLVVGCKRRYSGTVF